MNLAKIDNKKRRIRKKLYLGEFAIKGFEVTCNIGIEDGDEFEAFLNDFIDLAVKHNLVLAGSGEDEFDGFIYSSNRYGSVTEEQRTEIEAWLTKHPKISKVDAGKLVDVVYEF
ncbi:MAG: hypothetical protein ISEC1_P1148 [Thiomicrorhabdus sp.]|nr:MAG: hypothetical protein ISEC1_P1148 [Thiomicrorhabdus sp.]